MNEKKLPLCIWMIGISGSGKSTVAQHYAELYNAEIISSDSIRQELYRDASIQKCADDVFNILHERGCNFLKNNKSIIIDCTNIRRKYRKIFFNYLKRHKVQAIHHAVVMCTPYGLCLKGNKKRDRFVPEDIIYKQMCHFNIPFYEEGFDYITLYGWGDSYKKNLHWNFDNFLRTLDLMKHFNQKNPHHKLDLYEHCFKLGEILKKSTSNKILLRAALFHDVGKLYTQVLDEKGIATYYHHAEVGTYKLLTNLDIFDLTESEVIKCLFYVNYHMLPFSWNTDKTKEKYKKIFGEENYNNLCLFNDADKQAYM